MTALLLPAAIVLIGLVFEAGSLLSRHNLADRIAAAACSRAVKPTRTMTPEDSVRLGNVLAEFDRSAQEGGLDVVSRSAEVNWLAVDLEAEIRYETLFVKIAGVTELDFTIRKHCVGIPPFPHDGEVILDSNFVKPDGDRLPLRKSYGGYANCWDVYRYNQFGWDEGSGPGVEIQDWGGRCFDSYGKLPPAEYPSRYVVELDSDANSSITKIIELHPGRYQISVWYHGRIADTNSNKVGVYLQLLRPDVGQAQRVIQMAAPGSVGWKRYAYSITVDRYSIYKLTIAAEGTSDSYGGLINAFNVVFVDTK